MDYKLGIYIESFAKADGAMKMTKEVNNLDNAVNKASKSSQTFGQKLVGMGSQLNVLGQRMTWMVTVPLLGFANASIDTYVNAEKSFLRFQKVFSGTEEELDNLKKSAWELSVKFGKPVEEVTEIMTEFNKAGIDSAKDLKRLSEITIETATVFDTDLKTATEGVESIMFGFKLTIEQTSQAIADLNYIADNTTASEEGILSVLNRVSGVAKNADISIREVAAAQAIFAASAIPAGRAGNAIKSIIVSMDKQSEKARKQFREMGIDMDSVSWKTSSFTEKMQLIVDKYQKLEKAGDKKILDKFGKGISDIIDKEDELSLETSTATEKIQLLRAGLIRAQKTGDKETFNKISESLTEIGVGGDTAEDKLKSLDDILKTFEATGRTVEGAKLNEYLATLVGKFQISNLSVWIQGWDEYKRILEETNDPLKAQAALEKQMQVLLDSSVTKLAQQEQNYKKVSAELGEKLLPYKIELFRIINKLIDKFNQLPDSTKKMILIGAGLAAIAGPLLAITGLNLSALGTVLSFLKGIGIVGASGGVAGLGAALLPIAVALAAITAAWSIVKPVYDELQKTLDENNKVWEDTNKKIEDYKKKIGTLKSPENNKIFENQIKESERYNKELKLLNERYEGLPGVWNAIRDQFEPFTKWWKGHWEGIKLIFKGVWDAIVGVFEIAWGLLDVVLSIGLGLFTGKWELAWEGMKTGFKLILDGLGKVLAGNVEVWIGILSTFAKGIGDTMNKIIEGFNSLPSWMRGGKEIKFRFDVGNQPKLSEQIKSNPFVDKNNPLLKNFLNFGGLVYAANGFLARGKDTVPAMLSPGEMVLNKSQQGNLFDILAGRKQMQTAGGPTVNINVGNMIASRGEQREFARKIKSLISETER